MPTSVRRRVPWIVDLASVVAAAVCALVTWFFVVKLPGVDLTVEVGGDRQVVSVGDIVFAALVSAAAGFGLLRFLERLMDRPLRLWSVIAVLVAVASMLGAGSALTTSSAVALMSLHSVVAAVVIVAAWRSRS
ncbi:DUF6069 family protein [Phycicoccus jejuensis]|uniref:DUF6069 family protein n=1 Tax=Phycicoccus jejuensis TaxID=367299 RepID=UPI0012F8491E|nr:DUF6069 family protein [Phycicoccus jejuensis]